MLPSLICRAKKRFSQICDLVFPPFCPVCQTKSDTEFLCARCWELCAPIDPESRCFHCFAEGEGLCSQCRHRPLIPFPSSYVFEETEAARYLVKKGKDLLHYWLIYQWAKLNWERPDLITYFSGARKLTQRLSKEMNWPMLPLHCCDPQRLEGNETLLVIDLNASQKESQEAIEALKKMHCKQIFLLKIWQDNA